MFVLNRRPGSLPPGGRATLVYALGLGGLSLVGFIEWGDLWLLPVALLLVGGLYVGIQSRAARRLHVDGVYSTLAYGAVSANGRDEPEVRVGVAAYSTRGRLIVNQTEWKWVPKGTHAPSAFALVWDDLDAVRVRPAFGISAEVLTIRSRTGLSVGFWLSRSRTFHDFIRDHARPDQLDGFT